MPYRCANPHCQFDYYSMRAVCRDPVCVEKPPAGCGMFVERDGEVVWLCCYCAVERDPAGFIWRWQMENAEMSVAHEG